MDTAVWGYYMTNDANVDCGRLKDWSSRESYSTGAMTLVDANTHIHTGKEQSEKNEWKNV